MIIAGTTSGVAKLVESSLVRLMVPVIDFLADYLGLGGIPNAIKNVILGLQGKVEKILDRVIGFLVDKAKALWQAIKNKVKGKDDKKDGDKKDGEQDSEQEAPKSLAEPHPVKLEAANDKLNAELAHARAGQVIYQKGDTDPKKATKELLAQHADAKFDKASGRLTLPPVQSDVVSGASSLTELGQ